MAMDPGLKVQILATEHQSLSATRSLAWNEAFARAGMYLSALSGSIVALALIGQGSGFGSGSNFALFALLILPVVVFVGESTLVRLGTANLTDATCVAGMNRLRGGYLEVAPDLERFFVTSAHDDAHGIGVTTGLPGAGVSGLQLIAGTPFVIGTINAVVLAVFLAIGALQLGAGTAASIIVGLVGAGLLVLMHGALARKQIGASRAGLRPLFPGPPA